MYRSQAWKALALLGSLATGAPAFGQSFNIDIGGNQTFGIPANTYGAAAAQAGTWNDVPTFAFGQALLDLTGTITTVTYTDLGTLGTDFETDNGGTSGDDEALMDDLRCLGGPVSIRISGLADDDYDIYTYAWAPDNNSYVTDITVTGSSDPLQSVGGPWPGGHVLGVTYAFHQVTVTGGADVVIVAVISSGFGSINGFQIKPSPPPPPPPGTNFCISTQNSTGAASTMSATGSPSISANDLIITADNLPAQPGIFIAGPGQGQIPFFNGFLCIDPNGLQRFLNTTAPTGGVISEAVDYATSAAGGLNVVAGSSYNYQRWNRDPVGGGANANFSDGYEVVHTP